MNGLDLRTLVSQPPPRNTTGAVKRKIFKSSMGAGAVILLIVGGMFCLIGGGISFAFFPKNIVKQIKLDLGAVDYVEGIATGHEGTSATSNEEPVYRILFNFKLEDKNYNGECYVVEGYYKTGTPVEVEYLLDDPNIARVVGTDLDTFGYFSVFPLLFPTIGFLIFFITVIKTVKKYRKGVRLFINGQYATGKITEIEETGTSVNDDTVMEVTVSFSGNSMPCTTTYRTLGDDTEKAYSMRSSGTEVGVLYNMNDPQDAFVVEQLFG